MSESSLCKGNFFASTSSKNIEKKKLIYNFINVEKAYDGISRKLILQAFNWKKGVSMLCCYYKNIYELDVIRVCLTYEILDEILIILGSL